MAGFTLAFHRLLAILLGILLLAFVVYLYAGYPKDPFPPEDGYPYVSSRSCQTCHPAIYAEWEASWHSQSWTDPVARKTSKDFKMADCLPCHAPEPILMKEPGRLPLARPLLRKEGVSCLSCHRVADGVATPNGAVGAAPCRPVKEDRIRSVGVCRSCHNDHGTVDDWEKTPLKAQGRDCIACHMPIAVGKDGKQYRSHTWPGGHSKEMLNRAVRFDAALEGDARSLAVTVRNLAAGHNVPTELRHRSLDLEVTAHKGMFSVDKHLYRFRNPYKEEGLPNDQLRFGESRTLRFPVAPGSKTAYVRLIYRYMHRMKGGEDYVIQEKTVPLDGGMK
jgi:hypothetical protein